MCAEKDRINCLNREKEDCGDIIMEAELMGGVSKDENLTAFHVNGDEESNKKICSLGHDENVAVGNSLGIQKVISVEKVGQENTRIDGSDIGPIGVSSIQSGHEGKIGVGFKVKGQQFKSSWANMLDDTLNSGKGFNLNDRGKALSDGENEKDFFNDLEARKEKKRGKGTKKFVSLLELQNKSITASERRKMDKALRSRKWNKQFLKETELSEKSLSDSDIKSRVSVLVKEAKQVLNLVGEDAACGEVLLMQARFIGIAPVAAAVLLASWEVSSWSRSDMFAAFIDDGFFAGSWKEVL
ncbi:hypothetical protein V6N13_103221 [Hibiscus sabdariffa]